MKQFSSWLCLVLVFGMFVARPLVGWAAEHGGKEPAGKEHGGQEHGGAGTAAEADDATVLNDAADALEVTDAALAAELRAWAEGTGTGDKNALLTEAADALAVTDADLAGQLRAMVEGKEQAGQEHGGEATV